MPKMDGLKLTANGCARLDATLANSSNPLAA
jgi:hypothetical protein